MFDCSFNCCLHGLRQACHILGDEDSWGVGKGPVKMVAEVVPIVSSPPRGPRQLAMVMCKCGP